MIPVARDPRMDRPAADRPPASPSVVLWVPPMPEPVRELEPGQVGRSQWGLVGALLVVVAVQAAALVLTVPAWHSFDGLVAENIALRDEWTVVSAKLVRVELMLARLSQYDSRLRSLVAKGGTGGVDLPTEPDDEGGHGGMSAAEEIEALPLTGPLDPSLMSPADAWAARVSERLDDLWRRYEMGEAEIDNVLRELESKETVLSALPQLWPADGQVSSGFGWRSDPIHRTSRFHAGLDIAGDRGTPIRAVAPGVVTVAETQSGYGRVIDIEHGFGITTRYAHCTSLRVQVGDRVEQGDFIATMGSTGKSTGPHLHFEIRLSDAPHDPILLLPR